MEITPQEAIRRIEQHNDRHSERERLFEIHITEALNMAIAALEKQIPKEPEWKALDGFDAAVASRLACPNCGEGVTNYWAPGTKPAHCQFCGQALKWEETMTNDQGSTEKLPTTEE